MALRYFTYVLLRDSFLFQLAGQCHNVGCFSEILPIILSELGALDRNLPDTCSWQGNLIEQRCNKESTACFYQSGVAIPRPQLLCQRRTYASSINVSAWQNNGNNVDVCGGE